MPSTSVQREVRRQRHCRRDLGKPPTHYNVGDTALIDPVVAADDRVIDLQPAGQLDDRNHVRREWTIFHVFQLAFSRNPLKRAPKNANLRVSRASEGHSGVRPADRGLSADTTGCIVIGYQPIALRPFLLLLDEAVLMASPR